MVESAQLVPRCGSKGTSHHHRPNDGLKAAKRWFKSHLRSGPSKKDSPWSGEQAIARLIYAPREAAARKGEKS
jgi:hypothetical protein